MMILFVVFFADAPYGLVAMGAPVLLIIIACYMGLCELLVEAAFILGLVDR